MSSVHNRKIGVMAFLNSFIGVSGGDSRFVEIMKRLVNSQAIELTVVTPDMGRDFCRSRGLNATYMLTTHEKKVSGIVLLYLERIPIALMRASKVSNETVLYSAYQFLPDVLPVWLLKRTRRLPWVQTLYHVVPPPSQRDGPFFTNLLAFSAQKMAFALIKRGADAIFVLNSLVKADLAKSGFNPEKIHVIGAGVDISQIDSVRANQLGHYDACFLGRLHPSKGVFELPEIWKYVVSKKKDAELAIIYVGSEKMVAALGSKIKEFNLGSNVKMLPVSGPEALSIVKSCKVFVFPSHEEGWGIAITEAMACQLPVVAYNLPVYQEIFGDDIITVPVKDFKQFADKVVTLLGDDSFRKSLAEKGRTRMAAYDWKAIADKELAVIDKEAKNLHLQRKPKGTRHE